MTDLLETKPVPPPSEVPQGVNVPLWRTRLRLMLESLGDSWRLFARHKIGLVGLGIIGFFALLAVLQPILLATVWDPAIYDPIQGNDVVVHELTVVEQVTDPSTQIDLLSARLITPFAKVGETVNQTLAPAPPDSRHWLGTDTNGRDVLSQLMYGTRAAFMLGAIAALVTVIIATIVGSMAAYFGGLTDGVLMRLADLLLLVPLIPILIVVGASFTITMPMLGLILGLLNGFGGTAIILKSQALAVKVKPFIDSARVSGGGHFHIIFRHIIPNVLPLSFLYMMFSVTEAVSLEATLSFLGLLNINMSWGIMIFGANAGGYLLGQSMRWWLLFPAGLAVSFLAAAFFLVGRAMDEVVNPRLRRR